VPPVIGARQSRSFILGVRWPLRDITPLSVAAPAPGLINVSPACKAIWDEIWGAENQGKWHQAETVARLMVGPAKSPSTNGTSRSAIPPMPMPSSIASSTTRTGSISPATACGAHASPRHPRIDNPSCRKVGTGFRKTSCSNNSLRRDADSKKRHHALSLTCESSASPPRARLPSRPR
jgi:hypothetical protein